MDEEILTLAFMRNTDLLITIVLNFGIAEQVHKNSEHISFYTYDDVVDP